MKKLPFVSIVICTQNRAEALERYVLNSILKLDYPNYEVIVVDDASTDKTQEILKKYKNKIKRLKLIKNKKTIGLCFVRNLGVKHSKGEIIAFTDDDCIVDKKWLKELVKPYKDKDITGVGGKIYLYNSKKIFNPNKQISGCNMSFRKKILDKFPFDTNLYFNKCSQCDETELIYRLKNKNLKLIYANKAIVKHFYQPAKYRENGLIGAPLNEIYMYSKKISLMKYYPLLFFTLFYGKTKRFNLSIVNKKIINKFDSVRGLLAPRQKVFFKLPWIFYILLLKIPLKAKIRNYLEEKIKD